MNNIIYCYRLNDSNENVNKSFQKSREIICPDCGKNALITIDNYKIKLFCSKNEHNKYNISLNKFYDYQDDALFNIICYNCYDTINNNQKYACINCNSFLCKKCLYKHDNHYYISYNQYNNFCGIHYKDNNSYCRTCRKNLCIKCQNEHKNHEIIEYKLLYQDKDYLERLLNHMKNQINKLNYIIDNNINNIQDNKRQNILYNVKNNIDIFYKIHCDIFNNYKKNRFNYEAITNTNEIIKNYEIKDVDLLINENNNNNQFNIIYDIYKKMNEKVPRRILEGSSNFDESSNNQSYFYSNNNDFPSYNKKEDYDYTNNNNNIQQYSDINDNVYENKTINGVKYIIKSRTSFTILKKDNSIEETKNNDNTYYETSNYDYKEKKPYTNNLINKGNQEYKNRKRELQDKTNNENIIKNLYYLKNGVNLFYIDKTKKSKDSVCSVDKYGQKENFLKNRLAKKMPIDVNYKYRIYNDYNEPKGLYNLGLNCYMNSILQCLFYIPELRNYFIENYYNFSQEQPVCKAFSKVMHGLKYAKQNYFEASEFKRIMGMKNSLFKGIKAGDAKDLFFNLIDSLLDELKTENNDEITETSNANDNDNDNNKHSMYQEAKKETDDNIINNLFIGYYEIVYECKNQNYNVYSFTSESFILFNLEKIKEYYQKYEFTIEECFAYNFKRKYATDFFCSNCNEIENNNAEEIIYNPPQILVLILDRGHGKQFIGKVKFEKDLDIKNYTDDDFENNQNNTKYNIIGVCTHYGTSSSSGHYTACCLTDNNEYYYFSDTYVRKINENSLNDDDPYLLFYRRKENNN